MKRHLFLLPMILLFSAMSLAQGHENHAEGMEFGFEFYFGLLEVPFLLICIVYAFLTAKTMKGGAFGSGMMYMAWGFLVMAIGHAHMQIDHLFGYNLFKALLGDTVGQLFWVVALIITWALSGLGFYKIYKASK